MSDSGTHEEQPNGSNEPTLENNSLRIRTESGEETTRIADPEEAHVIAKASNPYRSRAALERQTSITNGSGIVNITNEPFLRTRVEGFAEEPGSESLEEGVKQELSRIEQAAEKAGVHTHKQLDKIYPKETTDRSNFTNNKRDKGFYYEAAEYYDRIASDRERWAQILHRNPSAEAAGWDVENLIQTEESIPKLEAEAEKVETGVELVNDAVSNGKLNLWTVFNKVGDGGLGIDYSSGLEEAREAQVYVLKNGLGNDQLTVKDLNEMFLSRMKNQAKISRELVTSRRATIDELIKNAFPEDDGQKNDPQSE